MKVEFGCNDTLLNSISIQIPRSFYYTSNVTIWYMLQFQFKSLTH